MSQILVYYQGVAGKAPMGMFKPFPPALKIWQYCINFSHDSVDTLCDS